MLDPNFHITTPRLHLSYLDPTNDAHMSFVVTLYNSPEKAAVDAQTAVKMPTQPKSIPDMRAALTPAAERLEKTGTGRYIISLRDADTPFATSHGNREFVGIVSMQLKRYAQRACPTIPDIGFVLQASHYGRGYATEACRGLIQHFRETRGYERFAGFTHPENVSSQKVFRRLGFEDRGIADVAGIVGLDGAALRVTVWLLGVSQETALSELGIGPGESEVEGALV